MADLYKGMAGSPITYLTSDITANQTTIAIADDSALPDAPNICTIGYGEHLETIKYETKSNGVLQNVTRGIEGTPRAWQAGTEVARFFTAYDHNAIIENFNSHMAESVTKADVIQTTEVNDSTKIPSSVVTHGLKNLIEGKINRESGATTPLPTIYNSMENGSVKMVNTWTATTERGWPAPSGGSYNMAVLFKYDNDYGVAICVVGGNRYMAQIAGGTFNWTVLN